MDPVQTSIDDRPAVAIAGMWADTRGPRVVASGLAESAVTAGRVCVDGTAAGQVLPPATALSLEPRNLISGGVVLFQHRASSADAALYDQYDAVNVVREGYVYLVTETALTKGTHPFVRFVAGVGEVLGSLRNDADTSDAARARWIRVEETVTGAGLVKCKITLPYPDLVAEYGPSDNQILKYDAALGVFVAEADA